GASELHLPRLAAVHRLVDAGSVAGAGAEQVGGRLARLAERLDVAKVEFFRAGHSPDRPVLAAVGGPRVGARCAADPGAARTHNTKAAEVGLGTDRLCLPVGQRSGTVEAYQADDKEELLHDGFPIVFPQTPRPTAGRDMSPRSCFLVPEVIRR